MNGFRSTFLFLAGILLAGLIVLPAAAQTATVKFDPNPLVKGKTGQLVLTVTDTGAVAEPRLSLPAGLTLQGARPNVTRVNINGRQSQRMEWSVIGTAAGNYTVQFPEVQGRMKIKPPPASVVVKDIKDMPKNRYGAVDGEDVFATIEMASTNLYRRQVVNATIKVYVRNGSSEDISLDIPKTLSSERNLREKDRKAEQIGSSRYWMTSYQFRTWPNTTGKIAVQPTLNLAIRKVQDRFGFTARVRRVSIKPVKPVIINVQKFPSKNRPASFSEAVGEFEFTATARPAICKVGDPITLRYDVNSANSVMGPVQPPKMDDLKGFKIYPPRLQDSTPGTSGVGGRKVYEQVIEPTSTDVKQVPAIKFSYFDPRVEKFIEITKGPFTLTVKPSDKPLPKPEIDPATAAAVAAAAAAKDPEPEPPSLTEAFLNQQEQKEIQNLYPEREVGRWSRTDKVPFYLQTKNVVASFLKKPLTVFPFLTAQAVPFLLFGLCFLVARRRRKTKGDVARARRKQAPKAARGGLSVASRSKEPGAFYEGVWQTLTEYFGNRLNLSPGEVESARVQRAFPDQADEIASLFSASEAARYGQASDANTKQDLKRLKALIRSCERSTPVS